PGTEFAATERSMEHEHARLTQSGNRSGTGPQFSRLPIEGSAKMGKDHRAKKTPAQYKKLANLLGQNMPVSEAMVKAGWSEQQAAKGWKKVPQGVIKLLPKSALRLINLGKTTPADDMR